MKNYSGLTDKEVLESRKKYGTNEITNDNKNSFIKLLVESLGDPIIKILLIALFVKIVFLFSDFNWFETLGILIAIFLASLVSSVSEYGSEKAFNKLQEESQKLKCKVKRSGNVCEIYASEVVVNDIVVLESGDKIPADGYIVDGYVSVNESAINGESKEVHKEKSIGGKITEKNKLYKGTIIYNGSALFKVSLVGENTYYGKIANELKEKTGDSPLKLRLRRLAKTISMFGYIGAFLAVISYLFSVIVINNNFALSSIIETISNFRLMADYIIYALTLGVTIIIVSVPDGLYQL